MNLKQFGGKITPKYEILYRESPQWRNGRFHNLLRTKTSIEAKKIPSIIAKQFKKKPNEYPIKPIEIVPFNLDQFMKGDFQAIWYGHSVLMFQIQGKIILIDPMLGDNASPIAPFKTKRFSDNTLKLIDQFPTIDFVLFTHDHYDHLDLDSVNKLKPKVKKWITTLGVGRHLLFWGIDPNQLIELKWWEHFQDLNLKITSTPSRHFSGRGLRDRMTTLWGGFFIEFADKKIWVSGDGGFGSHFKEINDKLGSPDLTFIECGQYNLDWPENHLFPDQSIQACLDTNSSKIVPIHWAGFKLSYQHTWSEPIEELLNYSKKTKLKVLHPRIGQNFDFNKVPQDFDTWWEDYK